MSVFGFLAVILGPLMRLLYQLIPNFAVTMIVFTVILRVAMLPLAIKQQKSTAKMSVFQPEIQRIQEKYKNNQEKQQEEMMKLQTEYGFNPMSGCLPTLLNMAVLFGIIEVVYRPVRYILGIPAEAIQAACEAVGLNANGITAQTSLIQQIKAGADAGAALTAEQVASIQSFNTFFMGMDMCDVPGLHFTPLVIFPVIAAVTMFASYILTQKLSGMDTQMQGSMKVMMWVMNIWFVYYCFTAPVGFSLYYGTSNICQIAQSFITYKIYSPEKFKKQYEEELAAKKASKKAKKTVTVQENGKEVTKEVTMSEVNKMRLEYARQLDAELYKDERTAPLNKEG